MNLNSIFENIREEERKVYFIHYSCQSLSDDNEGYSPRITSIAVLHHYSDQMNSFSLHLIAEELNILRENIFDSYDKIEEVMLRRFFGFIASCGVDSVFIHWNMKNINYGFEALEHRYRILTEEEPYHIPENKRFNISTMLKIKYGTYYADDPKMASLMDLNGGKHPQFRNGAEEASAFKAREFVKLHNSTMSKVYFFRDVYNKMVKNKLNTKTNQFRYRVNNLYQHPAVQIIGIIGIVGSLVSLIVLLATSF